MFTLALLPVLLFLVGLMYLDSYKLIGLRHVIITIGVGVAVAGAALLINRLLLMTFALDKGVVSRYIAPFIEESLKAIYLVYLLNSNKVGFMVDAAIRGFAIGAGFAVVENIYYLQSLPEASLYLWVIRGFGTAMLHGATTAIVGIISKGISERRATSTIAVMLPGLAAAILIHSIFNHFFLSPTVSTVVILTTLPIIMVTVFHQSEQSTRKWLGIGFDTDRELLEMITTGTLSETRIGKYLMSLESRFPGEIVADMLCLLRVHLELCISAKGILMMREAGFRVALDSDIGEKFDELRYLERSIGKTGQLAMHPFLHVRRRELWQLHMIESGR